MKIKTIAAAILFLALVSTAAPAQFANGSSSGGTGGAPAQLGSSGGAPATGTIIDVGQVFGFADPYINSLIGALISSLLSWVLYAAGKRFNVHISDSNRDALQTALTNQAASLIADGAVSLAGKKVQITEPMLAAAANELIRAVPDAVKYFGITPDVVAAKIIDKIPQVPAGAAMIAAANPPPQPPKAA